MVHSNEINQYNLDFYETQRKIPGQKPNSTRQHQQWNYPPILKDNSRFSRITKTTHELSRFPGCVRTLVRQQVRLLCIRGKWKDV